MISHKYKFICPRIGKNASSTLVKYFRNFDKELIDEGHESVLDSGFIGFLTGNHRCKYLSDIDTSTYFKFAFVRNPYDRLVSAWCEYKKPEQFRDVKGLLTFDKNINLQNTLINFSDFVGMAARYPHIHWNCQYDMIHFKDQPLVNYVGNVETLGADVNKVCEAVGIYNDEVVIPVVRRSPNKKHYSEYYDDVLRDRVAEMYKKDLDYFEYGFKGKINENR